MFTPVTPKVDFPKLEQEMHKKWYQKGIVKKYLHKNDNSDKKFSFLDGPITANNPMGVHHAWGRTYKDFWQRFWNMRGKKQRFQNGFDEQGLWVEVEVEKELGLKSKKDIENLLPQDTFKSLEKFINLCKERVKKYSGIQTDQSKRLGYFMDWDNSYHTSSDENNYAIWNFLKVVNEKGWLYKGHDTVPWCPRCGTAISQHEILTEEYKEIIHESVFFKLPIKRRNNEFLLVWTTTPWTIPGNVAVAINPKLSYVKTEYEGNVYYLAKERLNVLGKVLKTAPVNVKDLIGLHYSAPFDDFQRIREQLGDFEHKVIDGGELVTSEEGTGILHVAPGQGEEDFKLSREQNLPVIELIDEEANYIDGLGQFSEKNAKQTPEIIISYLKEKENGQFILKTEKYKHRYPTCWRCKTELVWRIVDEWYIAMDKPDDSRKTYREQMIEVAKKITWMPDWGLDRELDWLKNMHDWLISKKRYWGLALPIWECAKCGSFLVIGSKEELEERAISGWDKFERNSPHRPWVDLIQIECETCREITSRIPDVGNPWLDAGIVPFSTMPENWFPADFITESFPGQFKNWFYSLIAMSTALKRTNSFKRVLGFGSVRDEKGEEMHKSKGNAIEFNEAADKIGVDVMRWLYLRTNPEHNLNFGYNVTDEVRRKFHLLLWNIYVFFVTYANTDKWFDFKDSVPAKESILDRWIKSRVAGTIKLVTSFVERYDAKSATEELEGLVNDLSLWYVRRSRERVGNNNEDLSDKNAFYETLHEVLVNLSKLLAPFTPFIADEIFTNATGGESVHLEDWPSYDLDLYDSDLEKEMRNAMDVASQIHAFRKEANIKVRIPIKELKYKGLQEVKGDILDIVLDEVNVYRLNFQGKADQYEVSGDRSQSNQDLVAGEAREIIRKIQAERKKLGTRLDEKVDVTIPDWPKEFEEEIKRKALVHNLSKGDTFSVTRYA